MKPANNGRLATNLLGFTAVDIIDNPDLVAQKLDELFGEVRAFIVISGTNELTWKAHAARCVTRKCTA